MNPRTWTSHHRDALLTRVTVLTAGTAVLGTAGAMGLAVGLAATHPSTKAAASTTATMPTTPATTGPVTPPVAPDVRVRQFFPETLFSNASVITDDSG